MFVYKFQVSESIYCTLMYSHVLFLMLYLLYLSHILLSFICVCYIYVIYIYSSAYTEIPSNITTAANANIESTTPPYTTPTCYITQQPVLKLEQFTKLQLETLFYMFYVLPKDILQALSAQELYRREWKYHVEFGIWIKSRSVQEQLQSHPGVVYIYFDISGWDIKPFHVNIFLKSNPQLNVNANIATLSPNAILSGLLTDDDVRVNVNKTTSVINNTTVPPVNVK